MIPACFNQPNTVSTTTQVPQNLITCIYQIQLWDSPTYLTLTWSKTFFSHSLTIHASDFFSITVYLHPSPFSFFRTRPGPGSKSIYLTHHHRRRQRIKLYWDFTRSAFAHNNSAEPESNFYIALLCNGKLEFFVGDLKNELAKRCSGQVLLEPALLSTREHVFGHKSYVSRAKFLGSKHEIAIDCNGGVLKLKVDGQTSLVVKRLAWKFRGNERINVNGIEVEFFWDVFNWVNNHGENNSNNNTNGHGVFIFQVGDGGVWPEMVGPEKRLMRKSLSSVAAGGGSTPMRSGSLSPSLSCSSVLQWAEESNDSGRSSCSSTKSCGSNGGFSLLLYAWKKD
ncbi:hypothetical protein F3Y22_tig00000738pilonHSYRG00223 [Hibiscus syriacus]|uniref:Uncharacterized protein n=1 Tax=Hibiscus syriacus TaxID=106335 RepID=A0A6A3D5X9_HIBSY|nr:uncharacterized protein LOC120213949 [Hibiscus syriacus]KAE8734682.1 hypothetical protein F3Y22_tig00000738pilonHSYRG00223 [Hibiscus syriacus]